VNKTAFNIEKRLIPEKEIPVPEPSPIAICTPLHDSMPFINRYLSALTKLDYPPELISLYFTVQGKDGTYDYMKDNFVPWAKEQKGYHKIKIKRVKQVQSGELPHVRNVVHCRNLLASWSRPDPVFFIDHDNFPPSETLSRLRQTALYGGDISAAVYVFFQSQSERADDIGRLGFTLFFIENEDDFYYFTLDRDGKRGLIPEKVVNRRIRCDAVSMGTTLVQREVLDKVKFFIPWGTTMTDDTAYCVEAGKHGFNIISDFSLFIPHWGFDVKFVGVRDGSMMVEVNFDQAMAYRREKLKRSGVYPV
jgi:cellulose synthase/poly-beta-1,6-N-acetylglucosamine synthase-like glycosyltransferase